MAIKLNDTFATTIKLEDNSDVKKVVLDNTTVWCKPFSYAVGTKTGISSVICTRVSTQEPSASTGTVNTGTPSTSNFGPLYYGDEIYFTPTASSGYQIDTNTYYDSNHTLTVTGNITAVDYITAVSSAYTLTWTANNCTVECYSDSAYTTQITTASAGQTIYYKVIPNEHYYYSNSSYYHDNPYKSSLVVTQANIGTYTASAIVYTYTMTSSNSVYCYYGATAPSTGNTATVTGTYANRSTTRVYYKINPKEHYYCSTSSYYNGNPYSSSVTGSSFTFTDSTATATYNRSCSMGTYTWSISGINGVATVGTSSSTATSQSVSAVYSTSSYSYIYYRLTPNEYYYYNTTSYNHSNYYSSNFTRKDSGWTYSYPGWTATRSLSCTPFNETIQAYSITGGTVYWSTSQITTSGGTTTLTAPYGSTVYWRIAASTGYNRPATYYGSMTLNSTNFTIGSTTTASTATYIGTAINNCTRITWSLAVTQGNYIASWTYKIGSSSAVSKTSSYTITGIDYADSVVITATNQSEAPYNYGTPSGTGTFSYGSTSTSLSSTRTVKSYTLSITVTNPTYGTCSVSRTSSPYQGASTGILNSGATIYYGDVLVGTSAGNGVSYGAWNITSVTAPSVTSTGAATSGNITVKNEATGLATLYYNTSNATGGTSLGSVASGGTKTQTGLSFGTTYYASASRERNRDKYTDSANSGNYTGTNGVTSNVSATFGFTRTTTMDIGTIYSSVTSHTTAAHISGTLSQGTLPTGVASITCYRKAYNGSSFNVFSSGTIYWGDMFYWTATASTGYSDPTVTYGSSINYYTWTGTQGASITSVSASGLQAGSLLGDNITITTTGLSSTYKIHYATSDSGLSGTIQTNKTTTVSGVQEGETLTIRMGSSSGTILATYTIIADANYAVGHETSTQHNSSGSVTIPRRAVSATRTYYPPAPSTSTTGYSSYVSSITLNSSSTDNATYNIVELTNNTTSVTITVSGMSLAMAATPVAFNITYTWTGYYSYKN